MADSSNSPKVASVGSPSTNNEVTLLLNNAGRELPLVGAMLSLENPMADDASELAIGTVTEITTRNKFKEDTTFQGVLMEDDEEASYSGDGSDLRIATIRLQAAWRRNKKGEEWKPSGPSLRMSPATGVPVRIVDDGVIQELTENTEDLHYMGHLGGTENVRLPLSLPDFAGAAGAFMTGVYGMTGSGKALDIETPIATPNGWITMGKLKDGDQVFDENGNPCTVVKAHEILYDRKCYQVVFSDGSKIIADAEHLWQTETSYSRLRQSAEKNNVHKRAQLLPQTTCNHLRQIAKNAKANDVISIWEITALTGLTRQSSIIKAIAKQVGPAGTALPVKKVSVPQNDGTTLTVTRQILAPVTVYPKASFLLGLADHCEQLRGDQRHRWIEPSTGVRTTEEIKNTLTLPSRSNRLNHSIKVAKPLQIETSTELTIDPYVLGLWLADGDSDVAATTTADQEILEYITQAGYEIRPRTNSPLRYGIKLPAEQSIYEEGKCEVCGEKTKSTRVHQKCKPALTLTGRLANLKILNNKHIPVEYLWANETDRRNLLAGLMDGDGTVQQAGGVSFDNTNHLLAAQVLQLVASLGYRPTITSKSATLYGKDCGTSYRVSWTTNEEIFRLPRKQNLQKARLTNYNKDKNSLRYITEVNEIESTPVRCITVDSENHLYLAGETMIPTHNTQATSYLLAGQLRHRDHGIIIVDPQGQWAAEEGMAFSLQGFAAELGRNVRVRRISDHLRLSKDANLFCSLLGKTRFLPEITKMADTTQEIFLDELAKVVRDTDNWEDEKSDRFMRDILTQLVDPNQKYVSRIYADETRQERLREAIDDILAASKRFQEVLRIFSAIHNLFQATNPVGGTRHSLWNEITAVFDRPANTPAPLLILDMSSQPVPGMDDAAAMAAADAYEVLENDSVKAAVLRNLFKELKRASEDRFRNGKNLNTMVVLDEAWRYAPNPMGVEDKEIVELSRELAGYARDTRKFGIGWLYISQSTRSVNFNIWDQMSIRIFGFGLSGGDLDKMGEIVDDRSSLKLYRGFGSPRSTGRYPFLLTGPVSPLSANATPVVLQAYTDFQHFRDDNINWIKAERDKLGQPLASGAPTAPKGSAAKPLPRLPKTTKSVTAAVVETNQAVKANLATNGVKDTKGFGDPLSNLDDSPF